MKPLAELINDGTAVRAAMVVITQLADLYDAQADGHEAFTITVRTIHDECHDMGPMGGTALTVMLAAMTIGCARNLADAEGVELLDIMERMGANAANWEP